MSKNMNLTKKEKEVVIYCLSSLSSILISKKDKGITKPTISGTTIVTDKNLKITFEISVESLK
jgi:hypothetical protein